MSPNKLSLAYVIINWSTYQVVIQSLTDETLKALKLFPSRPISKSNRNDLEVKTTNYDFARKKIVQISSFWCSRFVTSPTKHCFAINDFFLVQPTTTVSKPKIETEFFSFFPNPKISDSTVGSSNLLRFFGHIFKTKVCFYKIFWRIDQLLNAL